MPSRSSLGCALVAALFFVLPGAALAAAPTITSPQPDQSFTAVPAVTGTAPYDADNPGQVTVDVHATNGGEGSSGGPVDIQPDGTWSFQPRPLDPGTYEASACIAGECATPVPFRIAKQSAVSSVGAISGSFSDLWRHRLKVSVTCTQTCDYEGTLEVSAADASRFVTTKRVIGFFSHAQAPKGTSTTTVTPRLSPFFQVWPLFSGPVAVTVRIGGASASGSLAWPKVASDRDGKGRHLIKGISGPRSVSLASSSVDYQVRMAGLPGTRYIVAGIDTPGNYLISQAKWYMDGRLATGADFRKGGTFTLTIPIAGAPRGVAKARQFAPASAEVQVGILNKHNSHDRAGQDQARYYIELTK